MKMEFVFDEAKMQNRGYTTDGVLNPIRKHLNYFGKNIKEEKTGIFVGTDEDFSAFAMLTTRLPRKEWFMAVIKSWLWEVNDHTVEDCLEELQ